MGKYTYIGAGLGLIPSLSKAYLAAGETNKAEKKKKYVEALRNALMGVPIGALAGKGIDQVTSDYSEAKSNLKQQSDRADEMYKSYKNTKDTISKMNPKNWFKKKASFSDLVDYKIKNLCQYKT